MDARLYEAVNGLAGRSPVLDGLGIGAAKYGPYLFMTLLVAMWFWPVV